MAGEMSKSRRSTEELLVDRHVGQRLRLRRTLVGLSQTELGHSVDLTFQQIQKYEKGASRIGASKLARIAKVLGVPISFFFDGISDRAETGDVTVSPSSETPTRVQLEIARLLSRIPASQAKRMLALVRAMASEEDSGEAVAA